MQLVPVTTPPDDIRRVLPAAPAAGVGPAARTAAAGPVSGTPYADLFNQAGRAHGVDAVAALGDRQAGVGLQPGGRSAPPGAQGLMQLMPATAQGLGVSEPVRPRAGRRRRRRLMSDLMSRFGRVDLALAAYNAGPGAVLRYDGIPPYPETQNYVRSVMASWRAS